MIVGTGVGEVVEGFAVSVGTAVGLGVGVNVVGRAVDGGKV